MSEYGLFESLYRDQIKDMVYSAVEAIRDNVKDELLKGLIEFDENPYIDRVFGKMKYIDQKNDLIMNGTRAEFKMYITVVD